MANIITAVNYHSYYELLIKLSQMPVRVRVTGISACSPGAVNDSRQKPLVYVLVRHHLHVVNNRIDTSSGASIANFAYTSSWIETAQVLFCEATLYTPL